MRKFLGVSLVAVLAVSPMMAQADVATVSTNDTTVGVASTKYVKEAYNAMAGAVNAELGTINTAIGNKQDPMSAGKGINITSNKISVDAGSGLGFDGDTDSAKLVVSGLTNAHIASGAAIDQSKISNLTTDLSNKVTNAGQFTGSTDSALVKSKTVVNAIKDTAAAVDGKVTNAGQFTGSTDSTLVKSKTVVNAIKDTAAAVDAINSAGYITKDVSNLTNYTTTTDMNTALSAKQGTLTPGNGISISNDTVSVKATSSGSGLSVTSSGVKVVADAANINSNAVTTAKIADGNVTTAKIADSNVTTAKIADLNVTTGKLAASAVTTAKIADSNVTTAKIADGAVTAAKLGAEIQLYSGWNSGGTPTANPTTVALVAPVHGS